MPSVYILPNAAKRFDGADLDASAHAAVDCGSTLNVTFRKKLMPTRYVEQYNPRSMVLWYSAVGSVVSVLRCLRSVQQAVAM